MLILEHITDEDGRDFSYAHSDVGFLIRQVETGQLYQDAMDLPNAGYTYVETDIRIPE